MADVFISYSRKDLDFAKSLQDSLQRKDLDVWVDIEGLYAGEEFWPEVTSAIDRSTVFVFIMTGNSLTSEYCEKEIAHAVASQKRLVPVCREDPSGLVVPAALAQRQWVFFRNSDDPVAALESLIAAIRADWVNQRLRARVYARAREWQISKEDPSLLLRGLELREAEDWLARSVRAAGDENAELSPTPLHERFLRVARRAVRRRRQRIVAATLASLAIISIVSWFGLEQRVKSLTNLSEGQELQMLGELEAASGICARFKDFFAACPVAAYSHGVALVDGGDFVSAVERFTSAIEQMGSADSLQHDEVIFLGKALQNRAYAQIMRAETLSDAAMRDAAYLSAQSDIDGAARYFADGRDAEAGDRLDVVRARAQLGTGDYAKALETLGRSAQRFRLPEIDLLLSLAHRCLQDIEQADRHFKRYITEIATQLEDPRWKHNNAYYQSIGKRCPQGS
jgi:hypothetical protein